jgi:ParB family chromosome partitioning protein
MQELFDSLLSENVVAKAELKLTEFIPIAQIQLRKQPRRYVEPEALKKLTESIRQHGMLQPLIVRPMLAVTARYELIVGERRFRAAQAAGLETVLVVVRELSDIEAGILTLVENIQRQDLNTLEETEGILELLALNLELTP